MSGTLTRMAAGGSTAARAQIALTARGFLSETFPHMANGGAEGSALAAGTIYMTLLGLAAGDVVSNLLVDMTIAASGTAPTLVRLGLADKTGLILATTADVKADAQWTAAVGYKAFPLATPAATYTVTASDGYYVCLIQVGSWGTTQPSLQRGNTATGAAAQYSTFARATATGGTAQTDLPAVAASATLASSNANTYWHAVN